MFDQVEVYDVLRTLLAASRWINRGQRLCDDLGIPVDMYHPHEAYTACDVKVAEAQEKAEEILRLRNTSGNPNFGRF